MLHCTIHNIWQRPVAAKHYILNHYLRLPSATYRTVEARLWLCASVHLLLFPPVPPPTCSSTNLFIRPPVPHPASSSSHLFLLQAVPLPSFSSSHPFLLPPVPSPSYPFLLQPVLAMRSRRQPAQFFLVDQIRHSHNHDPHARRTQPLRFRFRSLRFRTRPSIRDDYDHVVGIRSIAVA